jgi:8-oxo-dGTP pyrophosphatase MutT (NUDIX family)
MHELSLNAALIVLYDQNKRILLQHRTMDAERLPDYWAFFGGGIKNGEKPVEAVKRETMEELQYELKNPILFLERDFKLPNAEGHLYIFVEPFYGDKESLKLCEGQGWGWFSIDEIDDRKMLDHDKEIAKKIIDGIRDGDY